MVDAEPPPPAPSERMKDLLERGLDKREVLDIIREEYPLYDPKLLRVQVHNAHAVLLRQEQRDKTTPPPGSTKTTPSGKTVTILETYHKPAKNPGKPLAPEKLEQLVEYERDEVRLAGERTGYEHASVILGDGQVTRYTTEEFNSVRFPLSILDNAPKNSATVIHNHNENWGPSPEDLKGINEITAIGSSRMITANHVEYIVEMSKDSIRVSDGILDSDIKTIETELKNEAKNKFREYSNIDLVPKDVYSDWYYWEMLKRIANKYRWVCRRIDRGSFS